MNLKKRLQQVRQEKSAVFAFNFYNLETLKGVLVAAAEAKKEVILQLTQSSIEYMGLNPAVSLARAVLAEYKIKSWIHLDHSASIDLCKACLDAGFDSVMIDASEMPFAENVEITRRVVELAKPFDANVEAELGYVAKLGQEFEKKGFTDPKEANAFVEETGIDSLAVAIGSAHGFYKGTPKLELELLEEIEQAVNIPLVLHGGSGIPEEQIRNAAKKGICKINVATEIKNAFIKQIKKSVNENDNIDLRQVFPPAINAVADLVKSKLNIL